MENRQEIFLIHGVGNPKEGKAHAAFLQQAGKLGISGEDVHELNWNSKVPGALEGQKVDHDWLADLARSILATAEIGFGRDSPLYSQTNIARVQLHLVTSLRVVAACGSFLLLWGLLCLLFTGIQTDAGTPWAAYRFTPAAYQNWWSTASFITYPLHIGKWTGAWQLAASVWLLAVLVLWAATVLTSLSYRSKKLITGTIRRATLNTVGPIVYTTGLPFVFKYMASLGVLSYFILTTMVGVPEYKVEIVSKTTVKFVAGLSLSSYVRWGPLSETLLVMVGLLLFAALSIRALAPILKVLADIFRYLGNPQYRDLIQKNVKEKVLESVDTTADSTVIIAGHSLGSVIALDALHQHTSVFAKAERIVLITCGSPLKRLFYRFFRNNYRSPEAEFGQLCRNYKNIEWMNIFRPLDYIGGRLGNRLQSSIVDIRVPQGLSFHIGYWSDHAFVEAVKNSLQSPGLISESRRELAGNSEQVDTRNRNLGSHRGMKPFWRRLFPLLLVMITVFNYLIVENRHVKWIFEEQRSQLSAEGITASARLYRVQREVWEMSGEHQYMDEKLEYWVSISEVGKEKNIKARLDERFHDISAMKSVLNKMDQSKNSLPDDLSEIGKKVVALYRPNSKTKVHVPEFYSKITITFWRVIGVIVQAILCIFYAVIPCAIFDALFQQAD